VSRDWLLYLDDLIDSAQKIERFLRGRSRDNFATDELLFDAVLFNLALKRRACTHRRSSATP